MSPASSGPSGDRFERPIIAIMAVTLAGFTLLLSGCEQPGPEAESVASVNGSTITMEQVDARVQASDSEAWQSFYETRQRALAHLIDEQLLVEEATREGIERDSLVKREGLDKLSAISDSAIAAFYNENRRRMGGQSLEQMADRVQQFLAADEHNEAWLRYVGSLRAAADIDVSLDPPRAILAIGAEEPSQGPVDAPIQVVEYSDFECPYCGRAKPAVHQVLEEYGDRVRLVFRNFPLGIHANARPAAVASLCAQEQDQFWDYHDLLFAHQRELRAVDLIRYAGDLGLDVAAFGACFGSGRHDAKVDADLASGEQFGVTGTPAFFVNGRRLSGAQPFSVFKNLIDDELARLERVGG